MPDPTAPFNASNNPLYLTTGVASSEYSPSVPSDVGSPHRNTPSLPGREASPPHTPGTYSMPTFAIPRAESTTSNAGSTTTNISTTNPNSLSDVIDTPASLFDRVRHLRHRYNETGITVVAPNQSVAELDRDSRRLVDALDGAYAEMDGSAPEHAGAISRGAMAEFRALRAEANRGRADRLRMRLEGMEFEMGEFLTTLWRARVKFNQAEAEWDDYNDNEVGGVHRLLVVADARAIFKEAKREMRSRMLMFGSAARELSSVMDQLRHGL